MMANWAFTHGIHELGNGAYGFVQPDGTWGWSNAGLIVSDGETLLVDTLMSIPLTRDMLDRFKTRIPAASHIDKVVNTHANPDHFFGNGLVADAQIIATRRTREEMAEFNPALLTGLRENYRSIGVTASSSSKPWDASSISRASIPSRSLTEPSRTA
jgi:glyoxylase-like metal-dependent hydrolase (beta-lactamase superfamily II)